MEQSRRYVEKLSIFILMDSFDAITYIDGAITSDCWLGLKLAIENSKIKLIKIIARTRSERKLFFI